MPTIKENYVVNKSNVLNEIRANSMTLQEVRFFSIYLSKINPKDINTRVVRFSFSDFQVIMDLKRIRYDYIKNVTNGLLCKVVNIPNERGGYTGFQLFKECLVDTDENGEWYVEIDAHDRALPLMFGYQGYFFKYQLWNALRLRSTNQLRMYEILKQYEKTGWRVLSIQELKSLIGISENEYSRFNNFKAKVLDVCRQALEEYTDIKFTYEPYGKKGPHGKILSLKFTIEKNKNYKDQLSLDKFIDEKKLKSMEIQDDYGSEDKDEPEKSRYTERIELFMDACENEFSFVEIETIVNKMREYLPYNKFSDQLYCYHYISDRYKELQRQDEKKKIKASRYGYLKSIIGKEI